MKISTREVVTLSVVGVIGIGVGVSIAASTGLFGSSADAAPAFSIPSAHVEPEASDPLVEQQVARALAAAKLNPELRSVNASGQSYGTGNDASSILDMPELVAIWIDPDTIGYVPREQMFPGIDYSSSSQSQKKYPPSSGKGVTVYDSDGKTVLAVNFPLSD